jgi:(p)ppGpp synthase/HD superfamily hydrolase
MNIIEKAKEWSHNAHDSIGQKRKYGGQNYWVHTDRVAESLKQVGESEEVQAAGFLHDVLEDVADKNSDYNESAMRREFGDVITNLVKEVTNTFTKENHPNLNRARRKHLEHDRLSKISKEAKSIKLADIIDNVDGIVDNDRDFGKVFLTEKVQLLMFLKEGNSTLYKKASKSLSNELLKLNPNQIKLH